LEEEGALEKIVDTVTIKHPYLKKYDFKDGYKVLFVDEETNFKIEFEVIRYPVGDHRFRYYGVASKISGDLLNFVNIFKEDFEEGI
jgi:hypothetical protein